MKWLNRITSFSLMGFCVLIAVTSVQLGVGNLHSPGPGFMGFYASALLFFLSLSVFVRSFRTPAKEQRQKDFTGRQQLTKPSILAFSLCGYAFLLSILGYLISSFFLMFAMFCLYNPKRWIHHAVIAFIVVNASYLLFYKWLRVILPGGIFNIGW